jgi:hypothetical protein
MVDRLNRALSVLPYYGFRFLKGCTYLEFTKDNTSEVPLRATVGERRLEVFVAVLKIVPSPDEAKELIDSVACLKEMSVHPDWPIQKYLDGKCEAKLILQEEEIPSDDDQLIRLLWDKLIVCITDNLLSMSTEKLCVFPWIMKDLENLSEEMPMRVLLREFSIKLGKEQNRDLLDKRSPHLPSGNTLDQQIVNNLVNKFNSNKKRKKNITEELVTRIAEGKPIQQSFKKYNDKNKYIIK